MPGPAARAVAVYNLGRLGLFLGCVVLGAVAGLRGFVLLVVALAVSGVLSYFLLARQRAALAAVVGGAVERGRRRLAERTAREDAYVDALAEASVPAGSVRATPGDEPGR